VVVAGWIYFLAAFLGGVGNLALYGQFGLSGRFFHQ
jgi:hypothetical protein